MPCSRRAVMVSKIDFTTSGARPMDGSSSRSKVGFPMRARAMASICCSPPDNVPAIWALRDASAGNIRHMASMSSSTALRAPPRTRRYAPRSRFSYTVSGPKICRPSGTRTQPRPTTASAPRPAISWVPRRMEPDQGRTIPAIELRSVLFPAPLAPTMATISPSSTCNDAPLSTSTPP